MADGLDMDLHIIFTDRGSHTTRAARTAANRVAYSESERKIVKDKEAVKVLADGSEIKSKGVKE